MAAHTASAQSAFSASANRAVYTLPSRTEDAVRFAVEKTAMGFCFWLGLRAAQATLEIF